MRLSKPFFLPIFGGVCDAHEQVDGAETARLFDETRGDRTLVLILKEGPACILSTGSDWEPKAGPRKGLDA